jgi:hypothetical protein
MTIVIDGIPVIVEFVSCNHNMTLWRRRDTKVHDGYLYNIYSQFFDFEIKFHKRLKIYCCENGGYYVKAQGIRCYMNNLIKGAD